MPISLIVLAGASLWMLPQSDSAQEVKQLTFVTYNVLADPVRLDERAPLLLELLKDSNADVIALQEVVPWFVKRLAREKWIGKYTIPNGHR